MRRGDREVVTLFSIPKPFRGLVGIIQRNAIRSWLKLNPRCEIILLGDDEGVAEVAAELGVQHEPNVAKNEFGTPLLDSVFEIAQSLCNSRLMAYVNTDIILMSDFNQAVSRIPWATFVMCGRRWNLTVMGLLDFENPDWEVKLRSDAIGCGHLSGYVTDYFVFTRGLWGEIPPFAIGRMAWDDWLIYRARSLGIPLIDASPVVTAVHQNHDYSYYPKLDGTDHGGPQGDMRQRDSWAVAGMKEWLQQFESPEVQRNQQIAGDHKFNLLAATWVLTPKGLWPTLGYAYLRYRIGTLPVLVPRLRPIFRLMKRVIGRV